MRVGNITSALESFAPPALQESYDNSGLLIGSVSDECQGVLLTVDVTPAVVREAIAKKCDLIVAHHPLIFKGLKRLNGYTPVEQAVIEAVRNGIAIYACHTSLDNAPEGVSKEMAKKLGLNDIATLDPQQGKLLKLVVYVPKDNVEEVRLALFDAGCGGIGTYDSCSFASEGTGTFRPLQGSDPYVGTVGQTEYQPETRLEVIVPSWLRRKAEEALLQVHPYEQPAYEFIQPIATPTLYGCGAIGNVDRPISSVELAQLVKKTFDSSVARCTDPERFTSIRRVAMCGGSGSFLIEQAIKSGAQAFITSDTKYHDFQDYSDSIFIIDIGHHESENCTKEIFYRIITEKFPNFAVKYSETDTNPIKYL